MAKKDKKEEKLPGHCNLECKKKGFAAKAFFTKVRLPKFQIEGEGHQEFIAPVKVVLVTPPKREYWQKIFGAAFIVLTLFTIGASVVPMYFFSFSFTQNLYYNHTNLTFVVVNATGNYSVVLERDPMMSLHVILFTMGFQMLAPLAFLTMNTDNGASAFLEIQDKRLDYFLIKIVSLVCVFAGLGSSMSSRSMKFFARVWSFEHFSAHGAIGAVAVLLSLIDGFSLICFRICSPNTIWPRFSMVLCAPSFIASSVCFITSLFKPSFKAWLPLPRMAYFLTVLVIYYTAFSIWNPIRNLRCGAKL